MFIFSLDLNIPLSKKEEFEKILQEKHPYFYKHYLCIIRKRDYKPKNKKYDNICLFN